MADIEALQQKYESDINAQRTKVRALEDKLTLQERDLSNKVSYVDWICFRDLDFKNHCKY